ncbi:FHIPEP family type III secretion protein [Mesorhizobium calcicola]|uniref:FHIPEP family type III secretion protein n=1 Tax=Mesorhizobium calcicola TaxID=1300310 RepID=A0ABW4W908_9HYPH
MFRLAITITTTRLILLQADAGDIITAFGTLSSAAVLRWAWSSSWIITVAQFIVVSAGCRTRRRGRRALHARCAAASR